MTLKDAVNEMRQRAVEGVRTEPDRYDWAGSRILAGWSPRTVEVAVSAGALEPLRAVVDGHTKPRSRHEERACCALAILESGLGVEVTLNGTTIRRAQELYGRE